MRLTSKTVVLAVMAALLGGAWGLGRVQTAPTEQAAVTLPAVAAGDVTKITIGTLVDRFVLEKKDGGWWVTEPLRIKAEPQLVQQVLDALSGGPAMDATIDEGNLEDYGVDDQHALVVELFTAGEKPELSIHVGKTATQGSAFIRISGGDTVYRANIGPRQLYERPAAEWRDRRVLDLDPAAVSSLTLDRGGEHLVLRRTDAAWAMEGGPPVDKELADTLAKALATVRASRVHAPDYDGGFATPAAVATVTTTDGTSRTVELGAREDEGAGFLRVGGQGEIYRVSPQLRRLLLQPATAFRDRTLFAFDPVKVEQLSLVEGGLTVVVEPRMDGSWAIVQPANMDADQEAIQRAVTALSTLRAARIADGATFNASGTQLSIKLVDGSTQTMRFGDRFKDAGGQEGVRVKVEGRDTVYDLGVGALVELRRAFGRG